jgi:plasmid stabilization system protein ParE
MSAGYCISEAAQQDMEDIVSYIFLDNPKAAITLHKDMHAAYERIVEMPKIGHLRPEITSKPYRFWVFRKRYLVIYQESTPIVIIGVKNTYQNLKKALKPQ